MNKIFSLLFFLTILASAQNKDLAFREDFREVPAHIPATSEDLTSDFLTLERLGPGADQLKLSHHPEIPDDPHYLWNGRCEGPVLIAFPFQQPLDLSAQEWTCRVGSKNFGKSTLHLALRSEGKWFVQKQSVASGPDWNEQTLAVHPGPWLTLNPRTIAFSKQKAAPNFAVVDAIGFAAPVQSKGSKDCIRLDWFELVRSALTPATTSSLPKDGFLEPQTPFLRSALAFRHEGEVHFVRRGVIVALPHRNRWACFDPDTLRWAVIWEAPEGTAPITYDSMAGVSFPDKKAKATQAPQLVGRILIAHPQGLPNPKAGPGSSLPEGSRWQGISLRGKQVVLSFRDGSITRQQWLAPFPDEIFPLVTLTQNEAAGPLSNLTILESFSTDEGPSSQPYLGTFPQEDTAATPTFPTTYAVTNPAATEGAPFTIQNLSFPKNTRPIRALDIAFRKDGTGYLSTLDGDIWQLEDLTEPVSRWTRIATGLFEPLAIEVDSGDRLFTLGRDQITELIDLNGDGHIDQFRNASDAFLQTIHTRDYATSLAIGADGSFYLAKGGIYNPKAKEVGNEISEHRGTVLRISPDGEQTEVLADGLRLPYVGLRKDGTVFASDQQGNFVPSTPLHLISEKKPFLGHQPTNFQKSKTITEPLLWYPYQTNRSGAAFCTTSSKAFPDLPEAFLHVSWNGRLFAIQTPRQGRPFSWKLPLQLDFPALNGAVHPPSGRLFVTGLGISGYKPTTPELVGLASIEQSKTFPTPEGLEVKKDSITITFNRPLSATESITPGHPTLRLFNVKRTAKYGSGHYLWNDEPGEHHFAPKAFQLSSDRRRLELTFDSLHRSNLFDLQLNINTAADTFPIHLYTRPEHLPPARKADLRKLAEAEKNRPKLQEGLAKLGEPLFHQFACSGCHSLNGDALTGPALNGVAGRLNAAQLRQSILDPAAEITAGFEPAMPSFAGVIPPQDLEHLLAYLQTLQ